jgi:hypothetical protein
MKSLDELGDLDVDHRVLNLIRITLNKEFLSFQTISDVEFHKFFYSSFKQNDTNDEVYRIMKNICASDVDDSQISLEKINNFVSLYQVHPVLKKGEKNSSEELHAVMHQALVQSESSKVINSKVTNSTSEKQFERDYDQMLW